MKTITVSSVTVTKATGTLTASAVSNNDKIYIGTQAYTFKTTLSTGPVVAYEVLIGGSVAVALDNLKLAVNGGAGIGTNYSTGTAAHTLVTATTNGATTQVIESIDNATSANDIATTVDTGAGLSWGAATLTSGGAITVVGTVADDFALSQPQQQVTVGQFPEANPNWSRAVRLTNEAVLCIRYGAEHSVAMLLSSWTAIAAGIDPTQSWPPVITTDPSSQSVIAGASPTFSVVADTTELPVTAYQWQRSLNGGASWADVDAALSTTDGVSYSNYTTATLTVGTTVVGVTGYLYRCNVTNASGNTDSDFASLTVVAS